MQSFRSRKKSRKSVADYDGALYQEAIAPLTAATHLDANDAKAEGSLGESYLRIQDLPRARECFEKSVILDPSLEFPRFRLGYVCLQQNDYVSALKHFQAFLALNPKTAAPEVQALVAKLQVAGRSLPPKPSEATPTNLEAQSAAKPAE